jgi:hypothetical protein
VKHKHEGELARVLDVAPPQAYERGAEGRRSWWRRALELFGTFRRRHADALTREDVAEYRKQKAREELPVTDPERHLGLRVSRLEDLAKGLVVDGDVDVNDLGDNFEIRDDEHGTDANTGYSIHTPSDARNHERPNHLRLFQEGWEPRSFRDRHEDAEHAVLQLRGIIQVENVTEPQGATLKNAANAGSVRVVIDKLWDGRFVQFRREGIYNLLAFSVKSLDLTSQVLGQLPIRFVNLRHPHLSGAVVGLLGHAARKGIRLPLRD